MLQNSVEFAVKAKNSRKFREFRGHPRQLHSPERPWDLILIGARNNYTRISVVIDIDKFI